MFAQSNAQERRCTSSVAASRGSSCISHVADSTEVKAHALAASVSMAGAIQSGAGRMAQARMKIVLSRVPDGCARTGDGGAPPFFALSWRARSPLSGTVLIVIRLQGSGAQQPRKELLLQRPSSRRRASRGWSLLRAKVWCCKQPIGSCRHTVPRWVRGTVLTPRSSSARAHFHHTFTFFTLSCSGSAHGALSDIKQPWNASRALQDGAPITFDCVACSRSAWA